MWYKRAQNLLNDDYQRADWYSKRVTVPFQGFQAIAAQILAVNPDSPEYKNLAAQLDQYKVYFDSLNNPQQQVIAGNRSIDANTSVNGVNLLQDFENKYEQINQTYAQLNSQKVNAPKIQVEQQPQSDAQLAVSPQNVPIVHEV